MTTTTTTAFHKMAATPLKVTEVTCFVCRNSNLRYYNLDSRKAISSGFLGKLRQLLNDESLFESLKDLLSASVCRNCFTKVENTTNFIVQLRTAAGKYVSGGNVQIKRGVTSSPETPKSSPNHKLAKARKKLKLTVSPIVPKSLEVVDCETYSPVVHINADHGYTESSVKKKMETTSIFDTIETIFHNIKLDEDDTDISVLLQDLRSQTAVLTSRTTMFSSVLHKYRDVNKLQENAAHLLHDIVGEMIHRVPLLLKVMLCVAVPANEKVKESLIPALASAYSILMKHKYDNLSAYHRLTSAIAIRGGLDETLLFFIVHTATLFPGSHIWNLQVLQKQVDDANIISGGVFVLEKDTVSFAQTRFNHLGLVLCWSSRVTLQDSIQSMSDKLIVDTLKQNPLIKVTGDNLDIYVRTSNLSKERRNKDFHLFTSNIIFSRVAKLDMCNNAPNTDVKQLNYENITLVGLDKTKFLEAYSVLLARILCKIPAFQQYRKLVPDHLPHEFSQKMSSKSVVYPMPIMLKNESKHEDCLAIMDSYEEQLISLYTHAYGSSDILRKYGVPLGGDQLTRVRLQDAKNLRTLSATPEKRYDDLHPIVCEMWHTKQDYLEKCYKKLFKDEHSPGTLYHFKTVLHRNDVNGKVKGRFQSHFDLLMLVGECMVVEQFLEYLETTDMQPEPSLALDIANKPQCDQKQLLMKVVKEFMNHYGYGMVDHPETLEKDKLDKHTVLYFEKPDGQKIRIQSVSTHKPKPDELYNYSLQLCHWYMQLNELHDTAKEGDLIRTILNCQYSLPFFYSHSKLSKYLVENVDYVLKCKYLLSPLQRIRVLEGSYVNLKGGKGQNVESDLTQEHSVCNQKALIKSLGANKSENAIKRVTGSADTIAEICSSFDESVRIKRKSGHHSKPLNQTDKDLILKTLRKLRPFHITPGRKCPGFKDIDSRPVNVEKHNAMKVRLNQIITRLTRGLTVRVDQDDDSSSDENSV